MAVLDLLVTLVDEYTTQLKFNESSIVVNAVILIEPDNLVNGLTLVNDLPGVTYHYLG
ncbi:hypothetical protein J6590_101731, partial [Homalodisca vitripennis]